MKHIQKFEDYVNESLKSKGHEKKDNKLLDSMFNKLDKKETYNIIIDDRSAVCKMIMDNLECWDNSDGHESHLSVDIYLQENFNKKDFDSNGVVEYSSQSVYYAYKDYDLYKKDFIFADKESFIKFISNTELLDKLFKNKGEYANKFGKKDFINSFTYKNIDEDFMDVKINGKTKKVFYKNNLFTTSKGKKYYYDSEEGPDIKFNNEQDALEFFNQCEEEEKKWIKINDLY